MCIIHLTFKTLQMQSNVSLCECLRFEYFQLWNDVLQVTQKLSFVDDLRVSIVYYAGNNESGVGYTRSILDLTQGISSAAVTVRQRRKHIPTALSKDRIERVIQKREWSPWMGVGDLNTCV